MKILVCGSRTYEDVARVCVTLAGFVEPEGEPPTIMTGAARGADTIAAREAQGMGLPVELYPADWEKYGSAAGPIRNRLMLDQQPDLVVAFGEGRGTEDTVREAARRGIPVRRKP